MGPLGAFAEDARTAADAAPMARGDPEPSSLGALFSAGRLATRARGLTTSNSIYEDHAYKGIVDALNARGYTTTDPLRGFADGARTLPRPLRSPYARAPLTEQNALAWGQRERDAIWELVRRERARDPKFLPGMGSRDEFNAAIEKRRQEDEAKAAATVSGGALGSAAYLAGSLVEGLRDPLNLIPFGGGAAAAGRGVARELLTTAAREAAANAAATAAAQPILEADARRSGRERTAGEAVSDIATGAAFGAVLGPLGHVAATGVGPAGKAVAAGADTLFRHLPPQARERAYAAALRAGTVQDHELLRTVVDGFGTDVQTPAERGAVAAFEREIADRQDNPYDDTPAGVERFRADVAETTAAIDERRPAARETPQRVPPPPARKIISGIADWAEKVIARESASREHPRGDPNAQAKTSSAAGLGQFTGETWLGTMKAHGASMNLGWAADAIVAKPGGGWTVADPALKQKILALRFDARTARRMVQLVGEDYDRAFAAANVQATDGNRYLAHFFGPEKAIRIIKAQSSDPNLTVAHVVGEAAVKANPFLAKLDVREMVAWADRRMGGAGEAAAHADPLPPPRVRTELLDYRGKVARLIEDGEGEAPAALSHPEVGPIDLVWGDETGGLAHIVAKHPEVVPLLDRIVPTMAVASRSDNRVRLESPDHTAVVRLDYDGQRKTWLLTAFERAPAAAEDGRVVAGGRDGSPGLGAPKEIVAPPAAGKPRAAPRRGGSVDLLTQLADAGGLRDDGGHALVRSMGLKPGLLVRKSGRSIDEAGEWLAERGWFGDPHTARPTETDVIDLLDRANRKPLFHPDEVVEAAALRRAASADDEYAAQRDMTALAAEETWGETLSDAEAAALYERTQRGEDIDDAMMALLNARDALDDAAIAAADEFGEPGGPGTMAQVESLSHDIEQAIEAGELDGAFAVNGVADEDGRATPTYEEAQSIMDEIAEEEAALHALRNCL